MCLPLACTRLTQYERTPFFDAIIERGLRDGTKFNIEHVTAEEKTTLGIAFDRATGKFFLSAYGSPKIGRNTSRRGSQTSQSSSDGDPSDQQQQQQQGRDRLHRHPIVKEICDLLSAEIEAAGEHAEVNVQKPHVVLDPPLTATPGGVRVINFSVSIRRLEPTGVTQRQTKGAGAGAGPNGVASTADAGGGNPSVMSLTGGRGSGNGIPSFSPPALARGVNMSPKRFRGGNSPPSKPRGSLQQQQQQQHQSKPCARPICAVSEECGDGNRVDCPSSVGCPSGEAKDPAPFRQEGTKRRKSVAQALFAKANAMIVPKQEAQPAGSRCTIRSETQFGRTTLSDSTSRPIPTGPVPNYGAVRPSYLPSGVASMPALQLPLYPASSQQLGYPSIPRSQGFPHSGGNFATNTRIWGSQVGTGTGGRTFMQGSRSIPGEGLETRVPTSASPPASSPSWALDSTEYVTQNTSRMMSTESQTVTTPTTQVMGQSVSSGYVPNTTHHLSAYSEQMKQPHTSTTESTSDSHRCWNSAEDDDMDFLEVFF